MTEREALRIQDVLAYDKNTGVITWKIRSGSKVAGAPATHRNQKGYIGIFVNGKHMKAHRIAWLLAYGELPDGEIDHINGIKDDNRLVNLRLVTKSINQQNQRKARSDSTSGLLGVSWYSAGNKWKAKHIVTGKLVLIPDTSERRKIYRRRIGPRLISLLVR